MHTEAHTLSLSSIFTFITLSPKDSNPFLCIKFSRRVASHPVIPSPAPPPAAPSTGSPSSSRSSSQVESDTDDTQSDCSFESMAIEELLADIQSCWESTRRCVRQRQTFPQTSKRADAWAKKYLYNSKDYLVGLHQVLVDAGLGHVLGEDVNVSEMEIDPVVREHAVPATSAGVVAAGAPIRPNPCVTGMPLDHEVPMEPYHSPTSSGSKRKRSEVEEEEEEAQETDSCKRHKLAEEPKLEAFLEYLAQCSREMLGHELQKWQDKMMTAVDDLRKAREAFENAINEDEARLQEFQAEAVNTVVEIDRLLAILKEHNILHLVDNTEENMLHQLFFHDDEGDSVHLGMKKSEKKEVEKEEEKEENEVSSSPAMDTRLHQQENINVNANANDNNKENCAVPTLKQLMYAPFEKTQRVLKECHRRFQMRERRGETCW